ncbi:MAG: hypothetical protein U0470_08025 [Anaerolineae bacterium]
MAARDRAAAAGRAPTMKVSASWRRRPAGDAVADVTAGAGLERLGANRSAIRSTARAWRGTTLAPPSARPRPRATGRRGRCGSRRRRRRWPARRDALRGALGDPDEGARAAFVAALLAGLGLVDVGREGRGDRPGRPRELAGRAVPPAPRHDGDLTGACHHPPGRGVAGHPHGCPRLQHRRTADANNSFGDYLASCANLRVDALCGLQRLPRPRARTDEGWADGPALARLVTAAWPAEFLPSLVHAGWCIADVAGAPLDSTSELGRRAAEALFTTSIHGPLRWLGLVGDRRRADRRRLGGAPHAHRARMIVTGGRRAGGAAVRAVGRADDRREGGAVHHRRRALERGRGAPGGAGGGVFRQPGQRAGADALAAAVVFLRRNAAASLRGRRGAGPDVVRAVADRRAAAGECRGSGFEAWWAAWGR